MKLDRNMNNNGVCKYRLLNMQTGELEWNNTPEDECFVIKLKDIGASVALIAYAELYQKIDPEYSKEIFELSKRSGVNHPLAKYADSKPKGDYVMQSPNVPQQTGEDNDRD